jgi:hypothetical protein
MSSLTCDGLFDSDMVSGERRGAIGDVNKC